MKGPPVYPPSEDTDLLLQALAKEDMRGLRVCEVGSGSGVVARALQDAGAKVVAVDINPAAAQATRALGVPALRGDLLRALRGPFDVVVFNAPYLPSAPEERVEGWLDHAFHGGEGGIEVSARFLRDLRRVLAPGGRAYLVVSSTADLPRLRAAVDEEGLRVEPVASARFFFEEVAVWKLS
ncbi:MAG TPA: HemK2/MTQ2 family protein methyltransferase [Candidatus Thermoplasmatota archaeon]|nr:HemK2/MTQ2 family protein methyltransferase [Candidatus Thermoplasmatota archaeon]